MLHFIILQFKSAFPVLYCCTKSSKIRDESQSTGSFGNAGVWNGSRRSVVYAAEDPALTRHQILFFFFSFIIILLVAHTNPQLTQLSPSDPLQKGNYKLQTDLETSVRPCSLTEEWFMVLYLAAGQQAHGNEWALRRTWPQTLIIGKRATEKHRVTLLAQKEDIHSVPLCRIRQRNMQIASKQL